jgi:MFS family permease
MHDPVVARNLRLLVIELFWASIHIACVSFNAAYLIRLGGSNTQVSLLTAGGALVVALTTMPFAGLFERTRRRRDWIVGSLLVSRLIYALAILIPWLPGGQPSAMVGVILALSLAASLFSAGWMPLIGDLVPLERRTRLFVARNLTLGVTVTITTLVLGWWLERTPFPQNYQLLYALSVVTSLLSTVYVARMVIPERAAPAPEATAESARAGKLERVPRPFINITVNTLVYNSALWMSIPLLPIYFVRELGAAEGWLGLWAGLTSGGAIIGNLIWGRLIDRRGAAWVLPWAVALSALYFVFLGAFPNLTLILIAALLSGIIAPGVDLAHVNMLYMVCPEDRRTRYLGMFSTLLNVAAFLSPLLVAPLVDSMGARAVVMIIAGIRILGAVLFIVNPARPVAEKRVASATS